VKTISLIAPADAGAARIRVLGPAGEARLQKKGGRVAISTPFDPCIDILDAVPGSYTAFIEPLGEPPVTFPFVLNETTDVVKVPRMSLLNKIKPPSDWRLEPTTHQSIHVGTEIADMSMATPSFQKPKETSTARFSIGLSVDSKPLASGGWRPYVGPWLTEFFAASLENLTLNIKRGHESLIKDRIKPKQLPGVEDGARLRLSLSIEAQPVEHLLVPVFAGGVSVTFQVDPLGGLSIQVLPLDLEKQSLVKALSTALGSEAEIIWSDFTGLQEIEWVISGIIAADKLVDRGFLQV
jgi:hypothetical protein